MSERSAQRLMRIAEKFPNTTGLSYLNIGVEALAILAQNNTPDDVRETAELMSQSGEQVTAKISKEPPCPIGHNKA